MCAVELLHAQNLVASSIADSYITTVKPSVTNCLIDYSPNCTTSCGNSQLSVIGFGYVGGNTYAGFIVDDGVGTGDTVYLDTTAAHVAVVVGNNTSKTSHYLVGVVYDHRNGIAGLNLEIYDIQHVGTGSALTATLKYHRIIDTNRYVGGPMADIIAEYGVSFLGLPRCDRFAVTYGDVHGTAVYGYYSSLNNPAVFLKDTLVTGGAAGSVAAIQRYDSAMNVDNLALFTYNGLYGTYYREWNMTTNVISAPVVLDSFGNGALIAAIDDYTMNNPSTTPYAYYSAVGTNGVARRLYNNLLPPGGLDISSALDPTRTGYPSITQGPCMSYTVCYPQKAYIDSNILAMTVQWNTGAPAFYNSSLTNPFLNVNYYQVNNSFHGAAQTQCAVAATCNAVLGTSGMHLSFVYNEHDSLGFGPSKYHLYGKMTDCSMSFKTAKVPTVSNEGDWTLSPNPAIDGIILTTGNNIRNNTYRITDITGRQLQQATINSNRQQVDISNMTPGMYLLTIYGSGQTVKTIKFIKE